MKGTGSLSASLVMLGVFGVSVFFSAEAGTAPKLPAGWRELPDLVAESTGPVKVDERTGYGDPASGCFALLQRLSSAGKTIDAAAVRAAFGAALDGFEVGGTDNLLTLKGKGIEGRVVTGLRAEGGRVAATAAACFYTDRDPDRCRTRCDALLDSFGGGP
jgi:hypothetical protein